MACMHMLHNAMHKCKLLNPLWQCLSKNMQALNSYVDEMAAGGYPPRIVVQFWVRAAPGQLLLRRAELPSSGSLAPLFHAFGLISDEQLAAARPLRADNGNGDDGRQLLDWIAEAVREATRNSGMFDEQRAQLRASLAALESRYGLASCQV